MNCGKMKENPQWLYHPRTIADSYGLKEDRVGKIAFAISKKSFPYSPDKLILNYDEDGISITRTFARKIAERIVEEL